MSACTSICTAQELQLFDDVTKCMKDNASLSYILSVNSLKACCSNILTKESQEFIDANLLKVISLLLMQSPAKIQTEEKNYIQSSLTFCIQIIVEAFTIPEIKDFYIISCLSKIFDKDNVFYSGHKVQWNSYPGFPEVRKHLIIQFSELQGYQLLLDCIRSSNTGDCNVWIGASNFNSILSTMIEVVGSIPRATRETIIDTTAGILDTLTDEQLKKDISDKAGGGMADLFKTIDYLKRYGCTPGSRYEVEIGYPIKSIAFKIMLKMLRSGSIVLKLFAWEQLNDCIRDAYLTRPYAESYLVHGAGNALCNGEYKIRSNQDDVPFYVKIPDKSSDPQLSLFRCHIQKQQANWWYISKADEQQPGTNNDIDYYQHRSKERAEEREPPLKGWLVCNPNNPNLPLTGYAPSPLLTRKGLIFPPDKRRENYLYCSLSQWVIDNDILGLVFEQPQSTHREIVSRCARLVEYLAECSALQPEHLQLIWEAALKIRDSDVVSEIFDLLVDMSMYLQDNLFVYLIDLALDSIKANSNDESIYQLVVNFTDKFFNFVSLGGGYLSSVATSKLLDLCWIIYKNPYFQSLKNCRIIQDILSKCLSMEGSGSDFVIRSIYECIDVLKSYIDISRSSVAIEETAASRIIQTLHFLISKLSLTPMKIVELQECGFEAIIINELKRIVSLNAAAALQSPDIYSRELSLRLAVLRSFYGIKSDLKITQATLDDIWVTLSNNPVGIDAFFVFLWNGIRSNRAESLTVICSMSDCYYIYENYICSAAVDWSQCYTNSFKCFEAYSAYLDRNTNKLDSATPPPHTTVGLATLWRIYLTINVNVTECSEMLLKTYDGIVVNGGSYSSLLDTIFDYLKVSVVNTTICRCLDLLKVSVSRDKLRSDDILAIKGCMNRISLHVKHWKYTKVYNNTTMKEVNRKDIDSESVVTVEMHPLHTLEDLKVTLCSTLKWGNDTSKVTLEGMLDGSSWQALKVQDYYRLRDLNLSDGSFITASMQIAHGYGYSNNYNSSTYGPANINNTVQDDYQTNCSNAVHPSHSSNSKRSRDVAAMMSTEQTYAEALFCLAETCNDNNICSMVWSLLMILPRIESVWVTILQLYQHHHFSNDNVWIDFFDAKSITRTAYRLQVIDATLQPASEYLTDDILEYSNTFRQFFIDSGGPSSVLKTFVHINNSGNDIANVSVATCLHIICFLLVGRSDHLLDVDHQLCQSLLFEMQASSSVLIEKLLPIAINAAISEDSATVQDALATIKLLIGSADAAAALIRHVRSKELLSITLSSPSARVREMSADFAIQIGKVQPVVFQWLLQDLEGCTENESGRRVIGSDIYHAIGTLLGNFRNSVQIDEMNALAHLISKMLTAFVAPTSSPSPSPSSLNDLLDLLSKLLQKSSSSVTNTHIGKNLVSIVLNDFLFPVPSKDVDRDPICSNNLSRTAAFSLLLEYVKVFPDSLQAILRELGNLSQPAAASIKHNWGIPVDAMLNKSGDVRWLGLKNQGCTCYMNSLLQQLFMMSSFREAILNTDLKECHRTTLWHRSNIDLVGEQLLFEHSDGSWRSGVVVTYDEVSSCHTVRYSEYEIESFNIREGRNQKETGKVKVLPMTGDSPVTDSEAAAYAVLEQLQRTFCFLLHSKRQVFDPRPLVDVCKTLNLNFNVYQQNDAAECYDQLLDRIEIATKGQHTSINTWRDVILKDVFGGQTMYQKIPQNCEAYKSDKKTCGHWQSSRTELFFKVGCDIRGKDRILDSLDDMIQGEVMDGDNKVNCDVCAQKKATKLLTCIGKLPNVMVLHLKRFDLDFTTFETVKLNNRMEFPTKLNLLKYTKEGVEWEDYIAAFKQTMSGSNDSSNKDTSNPSSGISVQIEYEQVHVTEPNPDDYEYELQGALVHSGIAQGGHYYSFVRDGHECWFKFDDEDVTTFNPDNIPTQCYGGPSPGQTDDRTANALMLFYKKVKPVVKTPAQSPTISPEKKHDVIVSASGSKLINGYQAFMKEVHDSNMQYLLACYLLDPDMHSFVRNLLKVAVDAAQLSAISLEDLNVTVRYACLFLFDIVLHCRDVVDLAEWVSTLTDCFSKFHSTSYWFLSLLIGADVELTVNWLDDYLYYCIVTCNRAIFMHVFFAAINSLIRDSNIDQLVFDNSHEYSDTSLKNRGSVRLIIGVVIHVLDKLYELPQYSKYNDDLIVLIRELAVTPFIRRVMVNNKAIIRLCYFIDSRPDFIEDVSIRSRFCRSNRSNSNDRVCDTFSSLHVAVFETIAVLIGVPQVKTVSLYIENQYGVKEFTSEAKEALSHIFQDRCSSGPCMSHADLCEYIRIVKNISHPEQYASTIISKYSNHNNQYSDQQLTWKGYMHYYVDLLNSQNSEPELWENFQRFGFRSNLTLPDTTGNSINSAHDGNNRYSDSDASDSESVSSIPIDSMQLITSIHFLMACISVSESNAIGIVNHICRNNADVSHMIVMQVMEDLNYLFNKESNRSRWRCLSDLIKIIVQIDDSLADQRMSIIFFHTTYGLILNAYKVLERQSSQHVDSLDIYCDSGNSYFRHIILAIQELCSLPQIVNQIEMCSISSHETISKCTLLVRGYLKLKPGMFCTENEEAMVRSTVVRVEGAGAEEVNGDYFFCDFKEAAGVFEKIEDDPLNEGKKLRYTLYKCSLHQSNQHTNNHQWFISLTPENRNPGTKDDKDFYTAHIEHKNSREANVLPPKRWISLNGSSPTYMPVPRVTCYTPDGVPAAPLHQLQQQLGSQNFSSNYYDDSDDSMTAEEDSDLYSSSPNNDNYYDSSPNNSFSQYQ